MRIARTALISVALVVAGCGSSSASAAVSGALASQPASAAPTAAASGTASTAPASSVAPASSGQAATDPSAGFRIGAAYQLSMLDATTAQQMKASMDASLGKLAGVVQVGARAIGQNGSSVGLLMVLAFPGVGVDTTQILESTVQGSVGAAGSAKISKRTTIDDNQVLIVTSAKGAFAAYAFDKVIVYVYAATADDAETLVTSVIQSN
jgi:hypothetical protein